MERERTERFIAEATRLAEAFVVGLDAMFDGLSDDEVQYLTEVAAELLAAKPDDTVAQMIADAVNQEYGRRFNSGAAPTSPEAWIEF